MSFCLDFLIIHMVNDQKCKVYVLKFMLTMVVYFGRVVFLGVWDDLIFWENLSRCV